MKAIAALTIALAVVIGVVPALTDCLAQGRSLTLANGNTVPMKCHWTTMAEIAMAVPLAGLGIVTAFQKRKETSRVIAVIGILLGAFVILIPTVLIGVCSNPDMLCNSVMRPSLILAGTLIIALNIAGVFISERRVEQYA